MQKLKPIKKAIISKEKTVTPPKEEKYPNFKEFLWYMEQEQELLKRYYGRYFVIKDEEIISDYGSDELAWQMTIKEHKPGTFIIHHCVPQEKRRLPKLTNRQLVTVNG